MKIKNKAYAFMVISLFTGAISPIILSLAKAMNIYEFFMLTYLLTIPFSILLISATKKKDKLITYFKDKRKLLLIILIGLLSYIPLQFSILYAEHFVSASFATVIFRTAPLLMLLFLPAVLKERLSKSQIAALLLAFAGLYIAISNGNLLGISANSNLPITLFLILSALSYAIANVLIKKYSFEMSSAIVIFNLALFLLFGILFLITGASFTQVNFGDISAMLYVSVANNIIGFYMYFSALRTLKTTFVTNLFFLSPFITFAFASMFLGEPIQVYYILIAVLVAIGILIQKFDKIGGTYLSKRRSETRSFVPIIYDVTGAFLSREGDAVSNVIQNGGRALAVKVNNEEHINKLFTKKPDYKTIVFKDNDPGITENESKFVREFTEANKNDIVFISVGELGNNETLIGDLFDVIDKDASEKDTKSNK